MKRRMIALCLAMGLSFTSLSGVLAEETLTDSAAVAVPIAEETLAEEAEVTENEETAVYAEEADAQVPVSLEESPEDELLLELSADLAEVPEEGWEAVSEGFEEVLLEDLIEDPEEEEAQLEEAELATGEIGVGKPNELGLDLTWKITGDHVLCITGTGTTMKDFTDLEQTPWASYIGIQKVDLTQAKNLKHVGAWAFAGLSEVTAVTFPAKTTVDYSIGSKAFYKCSKLQKVVLPAKDKTGGLAKIENSVFQDCKALTSVTLPDTVTSIGDSAFKNCSKLTTVKLPAGLTDLKERAFENSGLTAIVIPEKVTAISASLFKNCAALKTVAFGKKETVIGAEAFYGCSALTAMTIPDTVITIEDQAFESCSALTNIGLGKELTTIGMQAFQMCSSLKSLTIPDKVKTIGERAFYYCTALTSVRFGAAIHTIGKQAFASCKKLSQLEIPQALSKVEENAFADCSALSDNGAVRYSGNQFYKNLIESSSGAGNEALFKDAKWTFVVSLSTAVITLPKDPIVYDGKAKTPAPVVKVGVKTLVKGTDYNVSYANNTNAGTATLTITGINAFSGTATTTFKIEKAANAVGVPNFTKYYSTKAQTFKLGATCKGGATLTYISDKASVTVDASGTVKIKEKYIGLAKITVTAPETANYKAATRVITVKVKPKKPVISKAYRTASTKIRVTWTTQKDITGYEVQLSSKKDFSKYVKKATLKRTTARKTFTGLKKTKTYYARMRSYKVVDGTKIYSSWSKTKTIKKL
ncbi:MAG: leucine-rich repeat protein [Lachnospiraceae bacterium]|nr:leucine-rich repeat protein [Lachnospiraceae bacterium]